MKKLAFVTSTEDPMLIRDDQLSIEPLKTLGYSVTPVVWDSPEENLHLFDAFIFRSCWNYHVKYELFFAWLKKLATYGKPILNPLDVNIWNFNKIYLLELQKKGIPLPQTEWIGKGSSFDDTEVQSKIESFRLSDQIVIRPAISLNGLDTYRVSVADRERLKKVWRSMPTDRDIIIQEFVPEILSTGETSLIFFNGEFSHAVRKMPAAGEFRIHSEYGGTRIPVVPRDEVIAQSKRIVDIVDDSLLCARVDIIERPQGLLLVELEILDPMLFLGTSDGAPMRFAKAIAQKLG